VRWPRKRTKTRPAVPDGATRGGTGHGLDVRAYDRSGRTLPQKQAGGQLPGTESARKQQGGRQRLGSISKQGNSMTRCLLVEAAQSASRCDEELRRDYQRLKFRRGNAVAKVAIARKLAVRLYWKLRKQNSAAPPARMQGSPVHLLVGASLSSY
jgi:hypothetical protein